MESSFAHDYGIVLDKTWLSRTPKDQFLNLIRNFSAESPAGRTASLLETKDKVLTPKQRMFKNRIEMWRHGVRSLHDDD